MRQLTLPFPPSVNGYWRSFRGRQILSKRAREYREEAVKAADFYGCTIAPLPLQLRVWLLLSPPDRRVRDIDNYSKGVLDALTHAKVWADDKQVRSLRIDWVACQGKPGSVLVTIEEL